MVDSTMVKDKTEAVDDLITTALLDTITGLGADAKLRNLNTAVTFIMGQNQLHCSRLVPRAPIGLLSRSLAPTVTAFEFPSASLVQIGSQGANRAAFRLPGAHCCPCGSGVAWSALYVSSGLLDPNLLTGCSTAAPSSLKHEEELKKSTDYSDYVVLQLHIGCSCSTSA